jgi:ComF family protein
MSKYEGLVKELISALKFDYIEEIAEKLAELFVQSVDKADLTDKLNKQLILPIPLHKKRFLERGFNQAELIAVEIAEMLNMQFNKIGLDRIKNTKQQANLSKKERFENMKDAFSSGFDHIPDIIYLFDDVFTTGQTMNEAAKALKSIGVKEVNVLVLAHGN